MKKELQIISAGVFFIAVILSLVGWEISKLKPYEPREKYVGDSMLIWDGKVTRCGLNEITDAESMYCLGYKEGYEWGGEQAVMFCKLDQELGI